MTRARVMVVLAVAAMAVTGLSGCIDYDCTGTPGCPPPEKPKPEPTPQQTLTPKGTGAAFCPVLQAYYDEISESYLPQGTIVAFDPDVFLSYGVYDLPPDGCSTGLNTDGLIGEYGTGEYGDVTWYVANPKLCETLAAQLQTQLAASGYSVSVDRDAAFHSIVVEGDRGPNTETEIDYNCTELRADNLAAFMALGPFVLEAGTAYASVTLNYDPQLGG
jgi:hypothetical protein